MVDGAEEVDAGFPDEVCAKAVAELSESATQQSVRHRYMEESYHRMQVIFAA
jgi:hypothetical protein